MRTPGRCTNTEGCWISASHRNVWLSVGENFVCPNCNGMLSPPLPQARSLRMVKRVAAMGAVASIGLAVIGAGAVELSHISWPGQSVATRVVQAPGALLASTFPRKVAALTQGAEAQERFTRLTSASEGVAAGEVAKAAPSSPFAMQLGTTYSASQRAAHTKVASVQAQAHGAATAAHVASTPFIMYTADGERASGTRAAQTAPSEEQVADAAQGLAHAGPVTQVSQTVLAPGASIERPVVLPISFGRPIAPETDVEPVSMSWHHHGVVAVRASHFLPAAPVSAPASADALAQICRIPSLMH